MRDQRLPGLHITDHQMRLYMRYRQNHGPAAAAAKAGFSTATGCRIENGRKHPPKTQGRSSLGGVCEFGWFSEQARTPPFIYNLRGALWNKCN
jgi:hypothetical protein